ncbi:cyclic pyranopterin monophosphate synthase MoaC [Candidatus Woesearchaeota archaeon]|nr:cyclic pyranopterin monophosphate synthase MoaC [Candidatus Woesearchaeota archaeon]
MIDISEKKAIKRHAEAIGKIILKKNTIEKIKNKEIKKGDVLEASKIAGINAVKQTPNLIPYCHLIPIDSAEIIFEMDTYSIEVICIVKTIAKTGVEMEALIGVTNALNTIWDMVKYLEKDEHGQYPDTKIENISIIKKWKQQ